MTCRYHISMRWNCRCINNTRILYIYTATDDDDDDDDVMMMMMMTLMKLVNSATKFRHGMDKFYQPNSGFARFQEQGRGYIYIYSYSMHIF